MITAISIMIFAAVFLAACTAITSFLTARNSPAAQLKRRMKRMSEKSGENPPETDGSDLIHTPAPSEKRLLRFPMMASLHRWIGHSGVGITPLRFVLVSLMAALSGFMIAIVLSGNRLGSLLAMLLFGSLPAIYLAYRKNKRIMMFDEQFPEALTMIGRSLRVGHSLPAAMELVSQEIPEPAGGLFKNAYERQQLGMRMTDALGTMLDRIDSMDLSFFLTIIRINSESGGNLSEILDKLAETIRSRLQVRRQVKVYTAEGRMSGYVLFLLPIVLFIVFYIMNPDYMGLFFKERICTIALVCAFFLQCIGFLVIRRIINIRL